MDGIELENQADEIASVARDRFHRIVAVTVAIVAVFMTVAKVKDDNIVQAMMAAQAHELDHWNHYQAKSIKQNLQERQIDTWKLMLETGQVTAKGKERISAAIQGWEGELSRYQKEKDELKIAAESARNEYDTLNFKDDQFDLCDALLGLAIALFAVSGLVTSKPLYWLGVSISFFGFVMGLAGFIGWKFHPSVIHWLT